MAGLLAYGTFNLMDALSDSDKNALMAIGKTKSYSEREVIHGYGDPTASVSIVLSGLVSLGHVGPDGSFYPTAEVVQGSIYGLMTVFADVDRQQQAIATKDSVVLEIDKDEAQRFLQRRPDITFALLAVSTSRLAVANDFIWSLRSLPTVGRLGQILLKTNNRKDGHLFFAYKQDFIASMLGVTRTSVSKAIKDLEGAGYIKQVYGGLQIIDEEGLSEFVMSSVRPIAMS